MHLFFSTSPKNNRFLTWLYLPFALFSDLAFFIEPLLLTYIFSLLLFFGDWLTLLSAFLVIGSYLSLNVLAEDTIPLGERIKLALIAPSMYFFFYLMSYVEYVALIKAYWKSNEIFAGLKEGACGWEHVARAKVT